MESSRIIPVPWSLSSASEIANARLQHFEFSSTHHNQLVRAHPIPDLLQETIHQMQAFSTEDLLSKREAFVAHVRARREHHDIHDLDGPAIPKHCRQVLRAASRRGISTSLFRELLQVLNYPDIQVCDHLEQGFPLVGEIPTNPHASPGLVQTATIELEELISRRQTNPFRLRG